MRKQLKGPVKARNGQTIRFHARLRKGTTYAFVEVYSSVNGAEPSPYIPTYKMNARSDAGNMLQPTTIRLSEARPEVTLTIVSDEAQRFYLFQDVDTKADKTAQTRIKKHGKIEEIRTRVVQAWRRLHRNG